jgi:hypothetical protein
MFSTLLQVLGVHLTYQGITALCRLTNLSQLVLEVNGAVANDPITMAAMLAPLLPWQMRQQAALQPAPFTYSLQLVINCGWQAHAATWQAIGRLSQLSSLTICIAGDDTHQTDVSMGQLSALTCLSSCLQYLELRIGTTYQPQQQLDCTFLSSLTRLAGEPGKSLQHSAVCKASFLATFAWQFWLYTHCLAADTATGRPSIWWL